MRICPQYHSLRDLIQNFTPNWFSVTMGTGVTGLCLASLPWEKPWIHDLASAIWLINVGLFIIFFLLWISGIILFPQLQLRMLKHSTLPFFLGCLPMGMTTLVNGCLLFGEPIFGEHAVYVAEYLWYFNAFLAMLVVIIVPYFMFSHHEHSINSATTLWLLPIVAPEVAASSAGMIAAHLTPDAAATLHILGYMLWGISLPLAFGVIIIFLQKMIFHKLPEAAIGATIWLPLGPIAMGALGLMTLGNSVLGGLIFLGFATWIALMALIITIHYIYQGLSYNMTFWSFTFPLGVYALSNLTLAHLSGIHFFAYYGTFLTLMLTLVWFYVAWKTLPGLIRGDLIRNPLL
jgi:C4-dicarboxylate transporter/malic acid transport protein